MAFRPEMSPRQGLFPREKEQEQKEREELEKNMKKEEKSSPVWVFLRIQLYVSDFFLREQSEQVKNESQMLAEITRKAILQF